MVEGVFDEREVAGVGPNHSMDVALIDAAVSQLRDGAVRWAATSPTQRIALLTRVIADTHAVGPEWNDAACRAKGLDPHGSEAGEELLAGVGMFVRLVTSYRESLRDIARSGRPHFPGPVRHRPGDRVSVRVLPASWLDRVLYTGDSAEVWMEPGVDETTLRRTQAMAYAQPADRAGVCLVLGAGNVAALAPKDVVHQLIGEGRVVVLKVNPVNDYLVEFWRRSLSAFIEAGYVRIVSGGADVGEYLVHHPLVDVVHITGSESTFDAIVFGSGDDGARRKAAGEAQLAKPVSAELGNVSPVIIVPGRWSTREVSYQAAHVATMLVNNAGFNCLTPRVLVTYAQWPQRAEFLEALEAVLATVPTRRAYYPGALARRDRFLAAHPGAHQIGAAGPDAMSWTVIRDVDPSHHDDVCFKVEAFCALTSETALDAATPEEFVRRAVDFCNDVVHGTLSMTLLVSDRSLRDGTTRATVEQAIADLRYGTIGLNVWHALGILIGSTPWGAYPGHEITDIQSGVGVVGNTYMFARPQKSVVRGPFVAWPTPAWFVTHRRSASVMRRLFDVQCTQRWTKLPGLLFDALRP